jgi:hypothetical protein
LLPVQFNLQSVAFGHRLFPQTLQTMNGLKRSPFFAELSHQWFRQQVFLWSLISFPPIEVKFSFAHDPDVARIPAPRLSCRIAGSGSSFATYHRERLSRLP